MWLSEQRSLLLTKYKSSSGSDPLIIKALERGDIAEFKRLLHDFKNAQGWDGATPLLIASSKGYDHIVDMLIQNDANVNLPKLNGVTPLLLAVQNKHFEITQKLLQSGADPDKATTHGKCPLHVAADRSKDMVELLLTHNADVNKQITQDHQLYFAGDTPMHIASRWKNIEILKLLLQGGAEFIENRFENTPLDETLERITPFTHDLIQMVHIMLPYWLNAVSVEKVETYLANSQFRELDLPFEHKKLQSAVQQYLSKNSDDALRNRFVNFNMEYYKPGGTGYQIAFESFTNHEAGGIPGPVDLTDHRPKRTRMR